MLRYAARWAAWWVRWHGPAAWHTLPERTAVPGAALPPAPRWCSPPWAVPLDVKRPGHPPSG